MEENAASTSRGLRVLRKLEPRDRVAAPRRAADPADVALVGALFCLSVVPILGALLRPDRWSPGLAGLATAAAILAGRELWSQLRSCVSARREPGR